MNPFRKQIVFGIVMAGMLVMLVGAGIYAVTGRTAVIKQPCLVSSGADYAEWFEKESVVFPKDIVGLNPQTGKARRYMAGDILVGVATRNPAVIGDNPLNRNGSAPSDTHVLVGLVGKLEINESDVNIYNRQVKTNDGKQLGFQLSDGRVFIRIKD